MKFSNANQSQIKLMSKTQNKSFASQVRIKVRNVGDSFTPMAGSK
jgi:hypothetical protein